jgi:Big-like domain-containing protein
VTYTPTSGAGTHTVRADYNEASSGVHATSFGTDDITVTKRTTSTLVTCDTPRAVNQASTCTAVVTDTDSGGKSDPTGNVNFTRSGAGTGTFSPSFCMLVPDVNPATFTSSCQVTYTPTSGSGFHTINGAYQGSAIHQASNDDFDIAVNLRSTSTSLSCVPPVQQVGQNITCTATVSDTDPNGSKSDPTGTVTFARNGSAAGSCTLVSDGNPITFTSSCSVTYSSTVATVDDIVATYGGSTVHAGSTSDTVFIVFYDANAGFVTGGGWIMSPPGACQLSVYCVGATGKANFGFVSKYQKGATVPTGNTEFQFQAGDLNFKSTSYDWLVVSGSGASKAQYKGSGTINGSGDYGFMLTATDGDNMNPKQPDKFRIKIWNKTTGLPVYDNQPTGADNADPSTVLGGGSIVIHK